MEVGLFFVRNWRVDVVCVDEVCYVFGKGEVWMRICLMFFWMRNGLV